MASGETPALDRLERILARYMSPITARSVVRLALKRAGGSPQQLQASGVSQSLVDALVSSSRLYLRDASSAAQLASELVAGERSSQATIERHAVDVRLESDIITARGLARQLADQIGFQHTDQIKISTVVSELARNVYRYAGGGRIELSAIGGPSARIEILVEDEGPGITNLDEIMAGTYVSKTGLGRGLIGCRALMDELEVDTRAGGGTRIRAKKAL